VLAYVLLDGFDLEHVLHEPRMGAGDPGLQPGGRYRARAEWLDVQAAEVAVVLGERARGASSDERCAEPQRAMLTDEGNGGERLAGACCVLQGAEAVLADRGREGGLGDTGGERGHPPGGHGLCPDEFAQPARWLALGGGAQIATWRDEQGTVGAGQHRPQLGLLFGHTVGVERQRGVGQRPVAVGQQRLAGRGTGQHSLARAEHDGEVERLPDGERQRPRVQAGADAPDAARRAVEFGLERVGEHGAGDGAGERIEGGQAVERGLHRLVGRGLDCGERGDTAVAAEPAQHQAVGEVAPVAPAGRFRGRAEQGMQVGDERLESDRSLGVALVVLAAAGPAVGGEIGEAPLPVAVAGHTGVAADALPPLARHEGVLGGVGGHVGEQGEQIRAANAAAVETQHVEYEAGDEALVQGGSAAPVPGDQCLVEVLGDQAGVGLVARPHDGDAVQRRAGVHRIGHRAHGLAHFFVRVGGVHRVDGGTVGIGGGPFDHDERSVLGQRIEERRLGGAGALGQEHDRSAGCLGRVLGGEAQQIGLVVPLVGERALHAAVHAHHFARPRRPGRGEPADGGRRQVAQLAVGIAQGADRGLVARDRGEHARLGGEHTAHGDIDDRGGERALAGAGERRPTEQLGQAEGGEELGRGHATVGCQPPPGGHADGVGVHEHRDGRQRIAALHIGERSTQRGIRRLAVGGGAPLDRHRPALYGRGARRLSDGRAGQRQAG
jgi:hypothetical protein